MCGICGQVNADPAQPVDRSILERMNAAMIHRGPDSDGFYLNGSVGLAMRRLAIVDLATGDQPIHNQSKTVWVVFNGEIYNYPDLRKTLESKGYSFYTNTDTEAIAHLYDEYGVDCVQHLQGMFAFALWDEREQRLLIGRDRLGQKPLYYTEHQNSLLFGSELAVLLQYPNLSKTVHPEALHHFLTLQYIPDPLTAFQGIHKLPPAHRLIWQAGQIHVEPYWDLHYDPKWPHSESELRDQIRNTVTNAVRSRLMSDVPLGAHLSGGIDSSIVVGLMAGMTDQPVKTFSIGFNETAFNELAYARQIADRYSTDHHEFILEPNALEILPKLVAHFGEPFADPAAIPTWYLSQLTRQHVTVALNGDGGDEAFAGYQRYYADPIADLYRLVPGVLRQGVVNPVLRSLPVRTDRPIERSYAMAFRQLAQAADLSHAASVVRWGTYFTEAQKWAMYTPEMQEQLQVDPSYAFLEASFHSAKASDRLDRTLYTDIHNYLPGALLPKVDRMTMAHSLEARSPFLDHQVMELAARLPTTHKLQGRRTKKILRDTFADLLPDPIEQRGKVGFGVPLGLWFRETLYDPVKEMLLASDAMVSRYIQPAAIAQLLSDHHQNNADHGKRLWALLNLEFWLRHHDLA